jgi:hypothetical protein
MSNAKCFFRITATEHLMTPDLCNFVIMLNLIFRIIYCNYSILIKWGHRSLMY